MLALKFLVPVEENSEFPMKAKHLNNVKGRKTNFSIICVKTNTFIMA